MIIFRLVNLFSSAFLRFFLCRFLRCSITFSGFASRHFLFCSSTFSRFFSCHFLCFSRTFSGFASRHFLFCSSTFLVFFSYHFLCFSRTFSRFFSHHFLFFSRNFSGSLDDILPHKTKKFDLILFALLGSL